MDYIQINQGTGAVTGHCTSYAPDILTPDELLAKGLVQRPESIAADDSYNHAFDVATKTWQRVGPAPNAFSHWDFVLLDWVDDRSLDELKASQWAQIKQARSQAEYAGFTWDGSTFDSDATSQNRITGAVTLAALSAAFTIDWVLADNSVRTLNAQEMCAVGAALGQHVAAIFSKGVLLREAIEVATSQAEVEALVW